MKKSILAICLLIVFITGCSSSNDPEPITTTSTIPADIYVLAGGNSMELTQSDAVGALTTVQATVEGTSFVFSLPDCTVKYDVQKKDPIDYIFWLTQPLTINYDPTVLTCANINSCVLSTASVSMTDTLVTATFSCP